MLNCYCQLSSSVIFRQYGVSQSECKIDRPRPGLPRVSPRPHTEALGTRLIHSIYNRSYGWDALQKHSVKTEVDCMLDGSQKHFAHRKAQRFE